MLSTRTWTYSPSPRAVSSFASLHPCRCSAVCAASHCLCLNHICSKRAFVVTDPALFELGMVSGVLERLRGLGIATKTFTDVEPDPTLGMVTKVR